MAEDEINEDFSRVLRVVTGAALQVHEGRLRREQMQQQASNAQEAEQRRMTGNAARVIRDDLYSREFWKSAGSESIADRMVVAASLGENDPAARSAWMHGADLIRSEFGVDLQEINRRHPSSLQERHAALRDALDDHFQQIGQDRADDAANAEASEVAATADVPGRSASAEDGNAVPRETAVSVQSSEQGAESMPVEPEAGADAEKSPDAMTEQQRQRALGVEEDTYVDTSGLAARVDQKREAEDAKEDAAKAAAPEHVDDLTRSVRRDFEQINDPNRPREQVQFSVREAQLSSFPREPQVLNPGRLVRQQPKPARGAKQQTQQVQEVLSR